MPSAANVQPPTPADLETRLAALGVPVDRLIVAAGIARSTWSGWRAGRTRPRPDKWAAAVAACNALAAEAAPAPAATKPRPAEPVRLTGSSAPTGAAPRFVPIATAAEPPEVEPVQAEAERVAALARREWAALGMTIEAEERRVARPGPRTMMAERAADRLCARMNRRLRTGCRALARRPATTPAALAAKARAALAVENATASDDWWVELCAGVVRDAAALPLPAAAARASPAEVEAGQPDGPLTLEQAAAVVFAPYDFSGWRPDTKVAWIEEADNVLVVVRLAYRFLLKDKAGAIAFMAQLADDPPQGFDGERFFEHLDGAALFFDAYAAVIREARTRCLLASAALALNGEQAATAAARCAA